MSNESFLKTACPKCATPIEFPREAAGDKAPCPNCGTEVLLQTGAAARVPLLIDAKATVLPVPPCGTVIVLLALVVLQFIGAGLACFMASFSYAVSLALSAILTGAFAKLIQSSHDTAQRMARLELFFQTVVNERR